jgi:hypothetical protein
VCLGGFNNEWVRVEGKDFMAKDWICGSFDDNGNSAKREYDVYNKGHARFVVRQNESGKCDLRPVTIDMHPF